MNNTDQQTPAPTETPVLATTQTAETPAVQTSIEPVPASQPGQTAIPSDVPAEGQAAEPLTVQTQAVTDAATSDVVVDAVMAERLRSHGYTVVESPVSTPTISSAEEQSPVAATPIEQPESAAAPAAVIQDQPVQDQPAAAKVDAPQADAPQDTAAVEQAPAEVAAIEQTEAPSDVTASSASKEEPAAATVQEPAVEETKAPAQQDATPVDLYEQAPVQAPSAVTTDSLSTATSEAAQPPAIAEVSTAAVTQETSPAIPSTAAEQPESVLADTVVPALTAAAAAAVTPDAVAIQAEPQAETKPALVADTAAAAVYEQPPQPVAQPVVEETSAPAASAPVVEAVVEAPAVPVEAHVAVSILPEKLEAASPVPAPAEVAPRASVSVQAQLDQLSAVARMLLENVIDYTTAMAPRKPVTTEQGNLHQVSLYRSILGTIEHTSDEDFELAFTALLMLFEEHREGVFSEIYVNRFHDTMPLGAEERKTLLNMVDLFKVLGPVKGRDQAMRQVDIDRALKGSLSQIGRGRVSQYFGF